MSLVQCQTTNHGFVIAGIGMTELSAWGACPCLPIICKGMPAVIGTFSYYKIFLPNFSAIEALIIDLSKTFAKFCSTDEQQKAFDFLEESFSVIPPSAMKTLICRLCSTVMPQKVQLFDQALWAQGHTWKSLLSGWETNLLSIT